MTEKTTRLSAEDCIAKADECAAMAERAIIREHKFVLERMAESWRLLASDIAKRRT